MTELERPFERFRLNHCSQNGEDGVISEIFDRLGINGGWVVEFGAMDGFSLSNTYHLIENDNKFKALYIEGDPKFFPTLIEVSAKNFGKIFLSLNRVEVSGKNSLNSILESVPNIPLDFELLSVDIDGDDYYIWESLTGYKPKVVIIEIDSSLQPVFSRIPVRGSGVGTSFRSMLALGKGKGYSCVCHTGNMIFVREDLFDRLGMDETFKIYPEKLFIYDWIK